MVNSSKTDTPCIGICSTVYGDDICRGCKRTYQEVIAWNTFSAAEKDKVYQRLAQQVAQIVMQYLTISDPELLQTKIKQLNIQMHAKATMPEQVFHLLRLGADKMKAIERYGISIHPDFTHLSYTALFNEMDMKLYAYATT